jgi:hypothetical protein
MEMCLQSYCLAMAVSADGTIPAFSGHATVYLALLSSGEKFIKDFRQ